MPHDPSTLPMSCPRCQHGEAALFISTNTVVTVRCTHCGVSWAADASRLPDYIQRAVTAIVAARRPFAAHPYKN